MVDLLAGEEPEKVRDEDALRASFDSYRTLLVPNQILSPQRQGLDYTEYSKTLLDPSVASTWLVDKGGNVLGLPQLCPVEKYEWLSQSFFEKKFPSEQVLHFSAFPEIEIGDEVKDKLKGFAATGGVLVYDFPEQADPSEYIESLLASLGVQIQDSETLGTQTYFSGKVQLKRAERNQAQKLTLQATYARAVAAGLYDPTTQSGAILRPEFDSAEIERLWPIYQEPFEALSENHPCRQGLTEEEFKSTMVDPDSTKIVYLHDGQLTTLCILGENISAYPWIDGHFYQAAHPDEYGHKQVVYFPGLVTDSALRGERFAENIIDLIAELDELGGNEMIVTFDCCDETVKLPELLEYYINRTPEANIKFAPIARQIYKALRLQPAA